MPQDDEGGFRGLPQGFLGIRLGAILYYSPTALSKERPSYYAVWGRELSLRFLWRVDSQQVPLSLPLILACVLHINGLWDGFGVGFGWVLFEVRLGESWMGGVWLRGASGWVLEGRVWLRGASCRGVVGRCHKQMEWARRGFQKPFVSRKDGRPLASAPGR